MRRRLAFLATLLLPAPALAQTPDPAPAADPTPTPTPTPDPPPAKSEPPEVRVIGDKADSLQRIPGSGTVIGKKDIERAQPTEVAEMLRRVPGLVVRQEYGGGGRLDIGVRGLDNGRSRHLLILEDGIPISLNPYAEPDMYYAPPIERMRGIEVVKGSGSILFGPQTIGGVVNFLTLSPPTRQSTTVDVEGGQYGYARALASYGDTFGSARYIVQGLYRRGDGFRDDAFESVNMLGKVAFDTSATGEATLKLGFHDDSAVSDDVGLTRQMYIDTPRRGTLAPDDKMHLRRYDVSLTHEERWEKTKLKTLLYAYDTNRIWRRQLYTRAGFPGQDYDRIVGDTSPNAIPNAAIFFQPSDAVLDRDYQVAGFEPRFETRFDTGPVAHTLEYGGRVLGETAHYQQRTGQDPTSYSGTLDAEETHRTIAAAAYAQDRIAFKEELLVTPGLRFEHASFHKLQMRVNGQDVNFAGDTSSNGLIPGIGAIYGSRTAHVFAGLHVGWAPPRITTAISPKGAPNQVSAEESINWEVGGRVSPTKWLRTELTLFASKFQNQVVANTAGASAVASGEVDAGETRHLGAEAAETLQIGRLFAWSTLVEIGARYTYARATFVGGPFGGNLLPYAPLHNVSANLDVEHKNGIGGQVAWTHLSAQYTDEANTLAEDSTGRVGVIPAVDLINATAHYRHKESGITVRLTIKNALDATYIAARRPEGIFTGGYRQVLLGVRWDWERRAEAPQGVAQ
jgi:Fe(3+) dicitrate transport protein